MTSSNWRQKMPSLLDYRYRKFQFDCVKSSIFRLAKPIGGPNDHTPFNVRGLTYMRLNKNTSGGLLSYSLHASDHNNSVWGERQNRYNLRGLLAIRRESFKVPAPVLSSHHSLHKPSYTQLSTHHINNVPSKHTRDVHHVPHLRHTHTHTSKLSPTEILPISESATDNGLKRTQAYNKIRSKGSSAGPESASSSPFLSIRLFRLVFL